MTNRGFTLIEILVAMAITSFCVVFVTYFTINVAGFGNDLSSRLESEFELQLTLRAMISEIRSMGPGGNGAYPIAIATASTFAFYSDIEGDGTFEQIRYFLDGTTLKKGVTQPTATEPVLYPSADEVVSESVHYLVPGILFTYYSEGLPGDVPPLTSPLDVVDIRMIQISGTVDRDSTQPPLPTTLSTMVTVRNLRGEI